MKRNHIIKFVKIHKKNSVYKQSSNKICEKIFAEIKRNYIMQKQKRNNENRSFLVMIAILYHFWFHSVNFEASSICVNKHIKSKNYIAWLSKLLLRTGLVKRLSLAFIFNSPSVSNDVAVIYERVFVTFSDLWFKQRCHSNGHFTSHVMWWTTMSAKVLTPACCDMISRKLFETVLQRDDSSLLSVHFHKKQRLKKKPRLPTLKRACNWVKIDIE